MNITVFQLRLRDKGSLHGAKLSALGNAPFGEHTSKEPVDVEDQRKAGSCSGEHRPVGDGVQGAMLWAHRRVCVVTLLTPCKKKKKRKSGSRILQHDSISSKKC